MNTSLSEWIAFFFFFFFLFASTPDPLLRAHRKLITRQLKQLGYKNLTSSCIFHGAPLGWWSHTKSETERINTAEIILQKLLHGEKVAGSIPGLRVSVLLLLFPA